LVVQVVNVSDAEQRILLGVTGSAAAPAARHRTSVTEDIAEVPPLVPGAGGLSESLPARSVTTYQANNEIARGASHKPRRCHIVNQPR
jgi:hypothetical protein